MRITVLASGSKGNSALVATSRTRILVDCGLSCREVCRRLHLAGEDPGSITAVVVSHEHSDHISGLPVLARKLKVPVYMSGEANDAWARVCDDCDLQRLELFSPGHPFEIGDITVLPFTVPHDAADPVAFTFRSGGVKMGVCTDLGYLPVSVREHLKGCDLLMVESNHDLEMLRGGPYPWAVKQRVMSRVGHLSNDALAEFFGNGYDGGAAFVILAHLSEQNNHPEIARKCAEQALEPRRNLLHNRLLLAAQDRPLASVRL